MRANVVGRFICQIVTDDEEAGAGRGRTYYFMQVTAASIREALVANLV